MTAQTFSMDQMKACKAIMGAVETGKLGGKKDMLVVLDDGAGITFGKHQTTENGGGLWQMLFVYYVTRDDCQLKSEFAPYKDKLYTSGHKSRKYALTKDEDFKDLLLRAAKDDPAMEKAQDNHFHMEYFRPALKLASDYEITIPVGLLALYDLCIHSGPAGAASFVDSFDNNYEEPDDLGDLDSDQAWIKALVEHRHKWLRTHSRKILHGTAYRTASYLNLMERGLWELEMPFEYQMAGPPYTKRVKRFQINAEAVKDVW